MPIEPRRDRMQHRHCRGVDTNALASPEDQMTAAQAFYDAYG
jgi:hypothetical protein